MPRQSQQSLIQRIGDVRSITSLCCSGRADQSRLERLDSSRHFVQHDSERKQVGARVDFFTGDLLRGHVVQSTQGGAGDRKRGRGSRVGGVDGGSFGQTEIQYLPDPRCVTKMLAGLMSR